MLALCSVCSQSCAFSSWFYAPEKKSSAGRNVDRLFSVTSANRKSWTIDAHSRNCFYCGFLVGADLNNPSFCGVSINYLIPKATQGKKANVLMPAMWIRQNRDGHTAMEWTASQLNTDQGFLKCLVRAQVAKDRPDRPHWIKKFAISREMSLVKEHDYLIENFIFGIKQKLLKGKAGWSNRLTLKHDSWDGSEVSSQR